MKHTAFLVAMLAALALAVAPAGCEMLNFGTSESSGPKPVGHGGRRGAVEVIIEYPEGKPVRQIIETLGEPTVLDVSKGVADVSTELLPNGEQRVVSIGGHKNDPAAGKLWVYEINGVAQSAAANTRSVASGDSVKWRFR